MVVVTQLPNFRLLIEPTRVNSAATSGEFIYNSEADDWSFRARFLEDKLTNQQLVMLEVRHRSTSHLVGNWMTVGVWNDCFRIEQVLLGTYAKMMEDVVELDLTCDGDPHTCERPVSDRS